MLVAFRYDDRRILSRFIAWWQRSDVSHCEVALRQWGETYDCASSSWLDGGVRRKEMQLPPEKWRIYEVESDRQFADDWASVHNGDGYDWLGLLGFIFRRIKGMRSRWICTEACAVMLKLKDPWRYDVAQLENFCAQVGRRIQ